MTERVQKNGQTHHSLALEGHAGCRAEKQKTHLEALKGKIKGLSDIRVITEKLPSSTADMMLLSSFTSAEALKGYSVNENHRAVADTYVRPFIETRVCMDFEE